MRGERIVGVDDRQKADLVGNGLAAESVGIAAAVEALVMVADHPQNGGQCVQRPDHLLADGGMIDDPEELLARQRALLVEQRLRHGDLTDVVQQPGDANAISGSVAESKVEGEGAGQVADALGVTARVLILRFQCQRQRADHAVRLLEIGVIVLDAQQRLDARDQLQPVQRIGDEIVGSGHDRFLAHRAAAVRGEDDDRQKLMPRIGAQQAQRLVAVHYRHEKVEQDDVDPVAIDDLHRLGAVFGE